MGNEWVGTKHKRLAFSPLDGKRCASCVLGPGVSHTLARPAPRTRNSFSRSRSWMPPKPQCSRSFVASDPYGTLRKSKWVLRPGYITQARY